MRSIPTVATASVLVLVAVLEHGPAEAQDVARFEGTFRYEGSIERQRELVTAAIERAVAGWGPVKRSIARRRLLENAPAIRTVTVSVGPDRITVRHDADRVYRSPVTGEDVAALAPDGEPVRLSHRLTDGRLIEVLASDEGIRTNVYELSEDGERLTMAVRFESDRLPEPIRYRLSFRRWVVT